MNAYENKYTMEFTCYLYCVSSNYTDKWNLKKLGLTIHPVHRMRIYNTGDAPGIGLDKQYDGIWQVNAKSRVELLTLEKHLHTHFSSVRQKRAGNNTEWFAVSFEEVASFLNSQTYVIRQLSIDEIDVIHTISKCDRVANDTKTFEEENSLIAYQHANTASATVRMTLKEEFFATFLPGAVPRRIQVELWDVWEQICHDEQNYRGIVQWVTGTGKTIATLMLFVLSAEAFKKRGQIFRGLLIAPKNDIFDTIIRHIRKVSKWGITVCEGHHGSLSSLNIPFNRPVLVTATHASLTESDSWDKLPAMTHCHYDEVHRITGEEFHRLLQQKLKTWNTAFLTGTSATPKTCSTLQRKKIGELFGSPLRILHRCDVDEAIVEGWIAQPRFGVTIMSNDVSRKEIVRAFINTIRRSILDKQTKGLWKGGKVIAYLSSRAEVCDAVRFANELLKDWHIYTAVEDADATDDVRFVNDIADGQPRILFACERYREGADINGIEMTAVLMGNTMAANIILQIAGRALRNDYEGKEGWCVIVRPSDENETEDDVFDSILLDIMDFIGKDDAAIPSRQKIERVVQKFFGPFAISGKAYNVDETIHRIQSMYARKAFERSDPKEKYEVIRRLNKGLGLLTKDEYTVRASEHPKYIEDPKFYFRDWWVSWYHFLGVDTSGFPQTKAEWSRVCKEMGIRSWTEYKEKSVQTLPANPGEMYEDYTNWNEEFGIEDEIVW